MPHPSCSSQTMKAGNTATNETWWRCSALPLTSCDPARVPAQTPGPVLGVSWFLRSSNSLRPRQEIRPGDEGERGKTHPDKSSMEINQPLLAVLEEVIRTFSSIQHSPLTVTVHHCLFSDNCHLYYLIYSLFCAWCCVVAVLVLCIIHLHSLHCVLVFNGCVQY